MENQPQNQRISRKEIARKDDGWGDGNTSRKSRRNKKGKSFIVPFLLGLCMVLVVLGVIIYFFTRTSLEQDGRSLPLKTAKEPVEYPVGAKKLSQPVFGAPTSETETSRKSPTLQNEGEFDFTPLDNVPIERVPVLPKKYIKEKKSNEFEDLWNNNSDAHKHLNISKDEYDVMTIKDLQNISHQYLPRWKANAANAAPINTKSIYALVVNYNPDLLPINRLPQGFPLTIAIDGYVPDAQKTVDALKAAGFEVLLNLPLEVEKERGIKSGVKPIMSDLSYDAIETRIKWHASSVTGHIGFRNRMGSPVLGALEKMNYMMHQIKELGLTFLEVDDPKTDYRSVAYATAETAGVPTRKTMHLLNEIDGDFQNFLRTASKTGSAVAVLDATEQNMILMRHILEKLQDQKEVGLVHLSRIYAFDEMKEMKLVH